MTDMISRLIIFIISFTIQSSLIIGDNPCRYESEKGIIDLSSVGQTNGIAAYIDIIPPIEHKYKYRYNPCYPFSKGQFCINVSSCQLDGSHTTALGYQETAKWIKESSTDENLLIQYTGTDERTTIIILNCSIDGTEKFEALGEDPMLFYNFRLTHKCACWNGCNNEIQNDIINNRWILLIIALFAFAFVIYYYQLIVYLKRRTSLF